MYHVISLILGLMAWSLGMYAIAKQDNRKQIFGSLLCCTGALLSQLLEIKRRVCISDWAALLDTTDVILTVAVILTAVTAVLNIAAMLRRK